MCGIAPWHIRRLCDNSWEGGSQYTPEEVGNMTLDQVFMLMADSKILRKVGVRKMKVSAAQATGLSPDEDGKVKGRTADGKPIKARIAGKSLARRLMEEAEKK